MQLSPPAQEPAKIQMTDVIVTRTIDKMAPDSKKVGSRRAEAKVETLNNQPLFDGDRVKVLGDIDSSWFWGLFKKLSQHDISMAVVKRVSARGGTNLKNIVHYHSGAF